MATYSTDYGEIRRDPICKDDYGRLVVYDQPPVGGQVITLQRAAMRSFQIAEERYAKKMWRPGRPRKLTRNIEYDVWGKDRSGTRTFRPIYLTGSIRSCAQAWLLYARDPDRYAHPNQGLHMHGLAIDVHTGYLNPTMRTILLNVGWTQSRPVDEPWHFSYFLTA